MMVLGAITDIPEAGLLRQLFPADCAVAVERERGRPGRLADCETVHVAKACAYRHAEFATGRACARRALRAFGLPPYAIPADAARVPVWPTGLVGSISHCPDLCAAALARRPFRQAIGLDIEPNDRLADGLRHVVATPPEQGDLVRFGNALGCDPFKLLFVLKEALFKLYFPTVRHFLDFSQMTASIDTADGTFEAEITDPAAPPLGQSRSFTGRFAVTEEFVMAGLVA